MKAFVLGFVAVTLALPNIPAYPATITVTNLSDNGGPGELRAAISTANTDSAADTITFASGLTGIITLDSSLPTITASVTIQGPGSSIIAVDGGVTSRILHIDAPGNTITISGLTLQHAGDLTGVQSGGAVLLDSGRMTIADCDLRNNTTQYGAALFVAGGDATIDTCQFTQNWAAAGTVYVVGGSATLENCTLTTNNGGAICSSVALNVTGCTIAGNTANNEIDVPGGVGVYGGTATMTNCTISNNSGDAVLNYAGTTSLTNCTVTENTGTALDCELENATGSLTNCILSGNGAGPADAQVLDSAVMVTATHCDIMDEALGVTEVNDLGGNVRLDPLLCTLADNGGSTTTIALHLGSPCLGTGTATGAPGADQRGATRPSAPSMGAWDGTPTGVYTFQPGLAMISTPEDFSGQTLDQTLGISNALLALWSPVAFAYDVTPDSDAASLVVGHAYWARFPLATTLANPGAATPTSSPFIMPLKAGWNMIGDPFPLPLSLATVSFVTAGGSSVSFFGAQQDGLLGSFVFEYENDKYASTSAIWPYRGYWICVTGDCSLSIPPPM